MKRSSHRPSPTRYAALYLALGGLAAGLCNGLLGAGGGIITVFVLSRITAGNESLAPQDVFANALCVMLPISAVSCLRYAVTGNLSADGFGIYVIPAAAGGLLGAVLLGRMRSARLKTLFSALVIYAGVLLILR